MYLNLYQKYILELLGEYGGLLKRQLEVLVKHFKEPHLRNIDGYLKQLHRFEEIQFVGYMDDVAVVLKGGKTDADMINSFDVMLSFTDYLIGFEKGIKPVALRFCVNFNGKNEREINVVPISIGKEKETAVYADNYAVSIDDDADKISYPPLWIFVLQDKRQMSMIKEKTNFSFAVIENGNVEFYENTGGTKNGV